MKYKKNTFFYFLFIGLLGILIVFYNTKTITHKVINKNQFNVKALSAEKYIIPYLKKNNHLPNYYITKNEARKLGWKPEKGNLCEVIPNKVIGGDYFNNRQQKLPNKKGRKWFEADLNYTCGNRGTDRVIFSNDGLIFVTYDHYKSFILK